VLRIGRHIRFTRTMLEDWLEARVEFRHARPTSPAPAPLVPRTNGSSGGHVLALRSAVGR
jgi:hypothetical protein